MTGMLEPVFKEVYKGRAEVREVFRISKVGTVAGCQVQDGVIPRDSAGPPAARQHRGPHRPARFAEALQERCQRSESRLRMRHRASPGYNDLKPGDIIEAFATEKVTVEAIA